MSDLFRVTFAFRGKGQGFSETLVFPAAPSTTAGAFYGQVIVPIRQKRAALLGAEYEHHMCRVSKIRLDNGTPVKRNVLLDSTVFGPPSQAAANSAEQPNSCLIVRTVDITGNDQKDISMGGIPDAIAVDGGTYNENGSNGWGGRLNAWAQLVVAASGGWLADKPNKGPVNITTVVINANKTLQFSTDDPLFDEAEIGTIRTIRVSGINGKSAMNGEWEVVVGTTTTCTTRIARAVFPYANGGSATSYISPKPFVVGVAWGPRKIGTHKRGRPLGATRGRLPARPRG